MVKYWKKNITPIYILVKDTVVALHKISEFIRLQSKAKFIAITGSNGKTTVKEMLAHVLSGYKITYTRGNLNNHIGVPLTIFSSNQDDDYVEHICNLCETNVWWA